MVQSVVFMDRYREKKHVWLSKRSTRIMFTVSRSGVKNGEESSKNVGDNARLISSCVCKKDSRKVECYFMDRFTGSWLSERSIGNRAIAFPLILEKSESVGSTIGFVAFVKYSFPKQEILQISMQTRYYKN